MGLVERFFLNIQGELREKENFRGGYCAICEYDPFLSRYNVFDAAYATSNHANNRVLEFFDKLLSAFPYSVSYLEENIGR